MLTKIRIEVEEETVEQAVEALTKYEHAIVCAEAQRYEAQWPAEFVKDPLKDEPMRVGPSSFCNWNMPLEERDFFPFEMGSELLEEVLEYDPGLPGWRGRRVVAYKRLDMRSGHSLDPSPPNGGNAERPSFSISHGTFYLGQTLTE